MKKIPFKSLLNNPINTLVIMFILFVIGVTLISLPDTIPSNATLSYKSVENTGLLGQADYFIFDTDGNRYKVFQDTFDSYVDLPRK